jgi:hypothetical protein
MAQLKGGTTIAGSEAWHAGNDGAGSGLDADLLDGYGSTSLPVSTAQQDALNRKIDLTRITSSATDTTAGRLLKVGDFGVTGTILFTGDTNLLKTSGVYNVTSTSTNKPGVTGGKCIVVQRSDSDETTQTWHNNVSSSIIFNRVFISGVWTAWSVVYTQDTILGTVSQTAGVPTGAIIESGSNANGNYVKYADGSITCWTGPEWTTEFVSDNSEAVPWTFPVVFISAPTVVGNCATRRAPVPSVESVAFWFGGVYEASTTSVSVYHTTNRSTLQAFGSTLQAIGRWF